MARIRCHYLDCVFLDEGFCSATAIELDPEGGCLTFRIPGEAGVFEDADEDELEEELLDEWGLEELGLDDLLEDEQWDDDAP